MIDGAMIEKLILAGKEASDWIRMEAEALRECSTVGGEWDGTEPEAHEEYEWLIDLADRLIVDIRQQVRRHVGCVCDLSEWSDPYKLPPVCNEFDMDKIGGNCLRCEHDYECHAEAKVKTHE